MIHLYVHKGLEFSANPSIRTLLAAAVAACSARGVRLTPLRTRVLELVAEATRPIKAYELLEQLRRDRGHAGPPTVYRTLDFLVEHGLVHKVAAMSAFVICRRPGDRHQSPLLVCERCGEVTEFGNELMDQILESEARTRGFRATFKTMEVQGICATCRNGPKASTTASG